MSTQPNPTPWRERLARARSRLLLDNPFFGCLALQLALVEESAPTNPTMATDGETLFVNPEFVSSLSDTDLEFVLAHEIMHIGLEHNARVKGRNPETWNKATDYVVNAELVASGLKAPKSALLNPAYRNLSADEIYDVLSKQSKQSAPNPQGSGGDGNGAGAGSGDDNQSGNQNGQSNQNNQNNPDPGGCGAVRQPSGSEAEASQKLAEQRVRTKQAAAIAKAQNAGKLPATIERMIQLAKPEVDWRALLRDFVDDACAQDYSWAKPSRRTLAGEADFYLPGTVNDGVSRLVVAIDTSGSIDPPLLDRFMAEVEAAATSAAIARISVIYADAQVQHVDEFELGDPIVANPKGGGGTRFSPTFDHIREHMSDASLVIYFTDLEVSDFGTPSDAKVLWAVHSTEHCYNQLAPSVPFGQAIHIS